MAIIIKSERRDGGLSRSNLEVNRGKWLKLPRKALNSVLARYFSNARWL
jgi:hypothetical protein